MTSLLSASLVAYGTARGAYRTYRALRADDPAPQLLLFWSSLAVIKAAEPWADALVGTFLPLYSVWKLALLAVWLSVPPETTAACVFGAIAPYERRGAAAAARARQAAAGAAVRGSLAAAGLVVRACAASCPDEDLDGMENHAARVTSAAKAERTLRLRRSLVVGPVSQQRPEQPAAPRPAAAALRISRKSRRRTAFVVRREPEPEPEPECADEAAQLENSPAVAQAPVRLSRTPSAASLGKRVTFGLEEEEGQ